MVAGRDRLGTVEVTVATDVGLVRLDEGFAPPIEGPITHLARGREGLWAVASGHEVWRAPEGTWPEHWERMADVGELRANCLLRLRDGVLVGTSEARLLRLDDGGFTPVRGFDEAKGRDRWFTPWGGPPDVRSLAAGPDGTLYANVHVGGVLRSTDGGATWAPTALDIETDVHQVLADPTAPGTVLAATAYGLAVSRDAGDSWELHDDGLHATYCRAVALTDEGPLISASRGHHGRDATLYRFLGDRFERCREGLPEWFGDNVDTHCLDARGAVAALGTSDGEVFLSRDAGATWEHPAGGFRRVRSVLLTDEPRT
jgi:photosystem II stability/assembly factor-like uncharacterized protein